MRPWIWRRDLRRVSLTYFFTIIFRFSVDLTVNGIEGDKLTSSEVSRHYDVRMISTDPIIPKEILHIQ